MTDPSDDGERHDEGEAERADALHRLLVHKATRRERARQRSDESIWSWLASFGLVGWTVMVPIVLGLVLGRFLDGRFDVSVNFTVTLIVLGAAVGVAMAWHWVRSEGHSPHHNHRSDRQDR